MCVLKMPTKQQTLKTILKTLLEKPQPLTREEIEISISKTLLLIDNRSLNKWFMLIWRLNYLTQIKPNCYLVNPVSLVAFAEAKGSE